MFARKEDEVPQFGKHGIFEKIMVRQKFFPGAGAAKGKKKVLEVQKYSQVVSLCRAPSKVRLIP